MTRGVTFTPSEADYGAAVRAKYRHRLAAPRFWVRIALALLGAVVVISGIALAFDGDPYAALATGSAGAVGGVAAAVFCIALSWLLTPRRAARLFRQQRSIHQSFTYSWSDDALAYHSDTADGRTPWADFRGWRETSPAFLIYMNDTLFQFLPQRAFTPEAAADLRATLERSGLPIY